jgi:hypothetical protein
MRAATYRSKMLTQFLGSIELNTMACYHIRWSDRQFDWECHYSVAAAESSARDLARRDERYSIIKCNDGDGTPACPSPAANGMNSLTQSDD